MFFHRAPTSPRPCAPRRARAVCLLACLGTLGLAGCGGGGSNFVSQADSICKTYNAKAEAITQPTTVSAVPGYLDQVTPLFAQGVAKLAALKPPSDKSTQFQQWISTAHQLVSALQQAQAAAHSGNINQAVSIIQQATPVGNNAKTEAKGLGLKVCGK